jgi:hypothetical protein
MDTGKEMTETESYRVLLQLFQFTGISDVIEFHKTEAYPSVYITRVKYSLYRHSSDVKGKITLQTKSQSEPKNSVTVKQ